MNDFVKSNGPVIYRPTFRKEIKMIERFMHITIHGDDYFACPACGEAISVPFESEHCNHTLFIYDNDNEEFVYVPEYNQEIIDKSIQEADERYSALDCAIGFLKNDTVIFYEVKYTGTACGPASYTFTIGIDLVD
jgi:hypothetical protein